ncbi:hypothetical protein BJX99DRAFT_90388 [Aspergillus californicus]
MLAIPTPPQGSQGSRLLPSDDSVSIMSPQPPAVNMACGLTSSATSRPALRPKLTLQTSSLPISFGSSTTGLSLALAAGPTASPTVRNTFKNAYEVPSSATASPSRSTNRFTKPSSPYTSSNYQLPLGTKSILRNSPLESSKRRSNSVAPSGPTTSSRRVFFPTKKQVSYRLPLEEEIKNVEYTARHSDLVSDAETASAETSSDSDSDYSTSSLVSSDTTPSDDDAEKQPDSNSADRKKKKRKYRSAERQVRAVARMEGLEDPYSQTPQTPRQGRLKRRREWRWTLGPVEETSNTESEIPSVLPTLKQTPTAENTPSAPIIAMPRSKPPKPSPPMSVATSDTLETNTALSPQPTDPKPPQ